MIRTAIVEDISEDAAVLEQCLRDYENEGNVKFQITRFPSGENFIKNYTGGFDIIFMDISMPGRNGMMISHALREKDEETALIFVTSLAQYAVEGYEVQALDYVLKPVNYYSFKLKIQKAVSYVDKHRRHTLSLSLEGETIYLDITNILYVEVQGHNLIYHCRDRVIRARGQLKNVEESLAEYGFYRCNYCFLVNMAAVTGVHGFDLELGGEVLQISRNRRKEFLQELSLYKGKGGR